MEVISIFDDSYNKIGECDKKLAHKLGLWHEVFTCIIVSKKRNRIVFQIKNHLHNGIHDKDLIEITVGGHIRASESVKDGIREIKEEVGLDATYDQLINIGIRQTTKTVNENYIIKEFQNIHILNCDKELDEYEGCADDEVKDLIEFDINELISLLLEKKKNIKGYTKDKKVNITLENFVEDYLVGDRLFLRLAIAAKRYLDGEDTSLIFW